MNEPKPSPPEDRSESDAPRTKRGLLRRSGAQLARLRGQIERRVRDKALAGIYDSLENITKIARDGGARDAPAAMRELRAIGLPEKPSEAPTSSAGNDVVRILEALPRLLSAMPGGQAAAPRLLAAVEADYELLEADPAKAAS
jgi:hypothetical protein